MGINVIEYLGGGTSNTVEKVRTEFGAIDAATKEPSQPVVAGYINELIVPFNYDNLPTYNEVDNIIDDLPANTLFLDAWFYVSEDFLGGTDYTVGTYRPDGVVIDADGIFTAADLPVASLIAGAWIPASGAQIGAPLATIGQVVGTANGVFTAGKGKIILRFIKPL